MTWSDIVSVFIERLGADASGYVGLRLIRWRGSGGGRQDEVQHKGNENQAATKDNEKRRTDNELELGREADFEFFLNALFPHGKVLLQGNLLSPFEFVMVF